MKSSTGFDSSMMLSIEQGPARRFWRALDNGRIVLGAPRPMGEEPAPEEQFSVIKTADTNKFGIKTGFMKYITVAKDNTLQGISDAIGPRECFEAIFQVSQSLNGINSMLFASYMECFWICCPDHFLNPIAVDNSNSVFTLGC